jgi:hypothetical protein
MIAVIKPGEKFEVVAAPAVAEGEMFLRSKTHLLCVSEGKTE